MSSSFLPKNIHFWLYHFIALLAIVAVDLLSTSLWGNGEYINVKMALLWVPLFTVAVLIYRKIYLSCTWQNVSFNKLIPLIILYGTFSGIFTVAIALYLTSVPLWSNFFSNDFGIQWSTSATLFEQLTSQLVVVQGLRIQLFICSWLFIYISITNNRRAKEAELSNLRLQNSLKDAQLSSLANQLNPHFLFNSINNIRFMIYESTEQADHLLIALSDILRYSLESNQQEKLCLTEELEIIDRYIAIVKVQLEHRLDFELNIPATLNYMLVPPMFLQLLVENAIKHGIDNLPDGGKLSVIAYQEGESVIFKVSNDMQSEAQIGSGSTGIGLVNIQQRLKLLYGDRAALNIKTHPQLFEVTVRLPKEN
jgi:sensor histidine kinase YesM